MGTKQSESESQIRFYAHSSERSDKSDWQLLSEHLISTGELAKGNAAAFGASEFAYSAGLLHDIGKYTHKFQRRIEGAPERVDHSTRGARLAVEKYGRLGYLLAYGVAGHHAGLPNGMDSGTRTPLNERLASELQPLDSTWQQEISLPQLPDQPEGFSAEQSFGQYQLSFLGRMLFSSLVDADFRETEAYYSGLSGDAPEREGFPTLVDLRERLDRFMADFRPDTPVNKIRADILGHTRRQSDSEPGLFSLTVPTGGGKTLASLAFALDHAIRHNLRRVIFVIPFTSIVEQNAAVFRAALGDLGDHAVLEHHSSYEDDPEKAPESSRKLKLAMENWNAPIVVTTSVQFFESLYADRPSRCRKLHNISGSVVILDEAQTLPIKLLRPCVAAMDELARNYRTSLVLCTATQPALKATDEFQNGLKNVRELAPAPDELFQKLKRVQLKHVGPLTDNEIAAKLTENVQSLCIVNNRRHARKLFEAMGERTGARHLTTLMCAKHRSQVLDEVREALNVGQPCRLVSTSLIEAGVDVDFPRVLRAEAGLDSIAQAAGRCNREGKRDAGESFVEVFSVADEWPTPPELEQFAQAARVVFRQHPEDPLSLEAINAYFRELYWVKESDLDAHGILERIKRGGLKNLPYEWMAEKFRMIESNMLPVIIPFDKQARELIESLRFAERIGGIARHLQPYLVQVPEQGMKALKSAGAVEPVRPEEFGEQFMTLVNDSLYSMKYGLNWDDSLFMRADKLVM